MILLYVMTMLTKLFCVLAVPFSVRGGSKKMILQIHLTIKAKTLKYKKPPHKKNVKKNTNKSTGSSKMAKIIFWVKIQIFERKKIRICFGPSERFFFTVDWLYFDNLQRHSLPLSPFRNLTSKNFQS